MATSAQNKAARRIGSGVPLVDDPTITTAITALTDNSGGTSADTIAAIGAAYSQTEVRNAVASLAAKLNAVLTLLQAAGLRD